jgi:hypothetical protein
MQNRKKTGHVGSDIPVCRPEPENNFENRHRYQETDHKGKWNSPNVGIIFACRRFQWTAIFDPSKECVKNLPTGGRQKNQNWQNPKKPKNLNYEI